MGIGCILVWGSWKVFQGRVKKWKNFQTSENWVSMAKPLVDEAWHLPERRWVSGRGEGPGESQGLPSSLRTVMSSSWENEELLKF